MNKRALCLLAKWIFYPSLFFCAQLNATLLFASEAPEKAAIAEYNIPEKTAENGYISPFQIFDNVYYVGDKWVSAYLIITDEGLILVDTLEFPYSKWLPGNIKQFGFDPADIKFLIITHGHSDHASGASWLQELTRATLVMSHDTRQLVQGINPSLLKITAPESKAVRIVADGEKLLLGQSEFIIHTTPGHTDGAISIQLQVKRKAQSFNALIFGGVGTNYDSLELADKYLNSITKLQKLHLRAPFDVNLANHPHRAQLFEKIHQRTPNSDPLVNSVAFTHFLKQLNKAGELRRREIAYKLNNQNR